MSATTVQWNCNFTPFGEILIDSDWTRAEQLNNRPLPSHKPFDTLEVWSTPQWGAYHIDVFSYRCEEHRAKFTFLRDMYMYERQTTKF